AVATINSSIGGGIFSTVYSYVVFKNQLLVDVFVTGILGGLVSITDSYYTRLRRLAQTCEFTNEEEEIKSHIILSCSSTRLRRRALREDMNLKALLDYGRGFEMSERQAKGIEEHEKLCKATEVQMVKPRNVRTKTDQKQCYRCGGNYPHQGRPCPALHETCRNCQKVGHFAKVCKSKSTSKRVNATKEKESDDQSDDSTDEEYTYRVTLHSLQDKGHPVSEVTIGNKTVKCLIDSGAGVNVIDSHTYNKLNIPLSPTSKKIYSYQAVKPLPVLGKFEANVISAVTNTSNIAQFYVVDGADGNLLGYKTATDLRLLHIVNTLSTTPKGTSIMDEYSDCFKGLGKMKDKTAKLHIDSSVKPLAQRHRRVPFHMRDQVEAELKNLQDLDIIERAEGPTPWVSPIVIVPKKTILAVGCIPTHGLAGIWGLIAVALFAEADNLEQFSTEFGVLKGGRWKLLGVQLLMTVVILLWAGITNFIMLYAIDKTIGLRMPLCVEMEGADKWEHGILPESERPRRRDFVETSK
ncbi:hypothetical protein QZH41_019742, partial [Actinostola sp. cb2023]